MEGRLAVARDRGMPRIGRVIVGFVALLLVAACSPAATPTPTASGVPSPGPSGAPSTGPSGGLPADEVRVVAGLYSGRPDPTWTLSDGEIAALDRAIAGLPDRLGEPPSGGLGYHGFTVTRSGRTFVAYLGTVAPVGVGPRSFKADQNRIVERLLLETGRSHLTDAEFAEVVRALAGS